ncbi:enoyl-CoA hydratase/isomerase family protein [Flavihumibacter profundi]|uniref:enoyl-CoA hydratase/isomerase family protein n=1 Tax=Flavihumibacter profundi TaxID=2716883 RepID=UPI001CC36A1E|nr:enoyl-CoA hydratase/isomerase family protein [Flavihumibacter profundi]MBZ5857489.1 enoyl-CoA hydratase/isomerase family protein [Flavihumibacter profundi]
MIQETSGGYVKSELHKGIATIEFYHPQGNSLPAKLLHKMSEEIDTLGHLPEVKVIILRSGGDGVFCSGASFDELSNIQTAEQGLAFFNGFAQVINAMRKIPKLIIGRIHGKCVGGGVGLAAAVDYAIAVEGADVKLSELAIGIGAFVVGPAIERKIGGSAFSQLAIDTSMWRNSDWARRKGLYAELHTNLEDLDESVQRIAENLVHSSPDALVEMKKMFWKGTEHWDHLLLERAAISGRLVLSEFSKQAIAKFKSKVKT